MYLVNHTEPVKQRVNSNINDELYDKLMITYPKAPRLKGDSLQAPEPGGEEGRQCDLCRPEPPVGAPRRRRGDCPARRGEAAGLEPPVGALRRGRGDHPALMCRGRQA